MAIEHKYKVQDDDEIFDNPMDAVMKAAYLSQQNGGIEYKVMSGVKFTRRPDFEWVTLSGVTLPADVTNKGPIAYIE